MKVAAVFGSIMVLGALPHGGWKCTQMNVHWSQICELMLYNFGMGHEITEKKNENIVQKEKNTVDHNEVTKWFKKFLLDYKNLDNQVRSDRPKTINSKAICQVLEANLVSSTWSESGELDISKFIVVCHIHKLSKICCIVPHTAKILLNFWLTLVQKLIAFTFCLFLIRHIILIFLLFFFTKIPPKQDQLSHDSVKWDDMTRRVKWMGRMSGKGNINV